MGHSQADTRVQFYRGERGIKQMGWNILRAKNEVVGFTYRAYEEIVGKDFEDELFTEMLLKKINFRDIYSDAYLESVSNLKQKVQATHQKPFHQIITSRYVPANVLRIEHQVDIYNDVVAHYNWYEGEVFGIEMYNPKIADFYKQLFELVWKQAEPEEELLKSLG